MGKVTCGACKRSCKGQAVRLQDKHYHVKCFKCKECKKPLASGGFYAKEDFFYCADDYQRLFGMKCGECGKYVEGEVITALGNTYHKNCFDCTKCKNKFGPGDKVTFNGKDYLCNKCLEQYEAEQALSKATVNGTADGRHPLQGVQGVPITSTPAKPLHAVIDGALTPASESELSDSSAFRNGQLMGPLSPISIASSGPPSPYQYRGSESDVFYDDGYKIQNSENPFRKSDSDMNGYQGGRLSPVQAMLQYRSPSPADSAISRASAQTKDSASSYEPKFRVDYSKFYKGSYLKSDNERSRYRRGPSINVTSKPKSPHFHRPENFSYKNVRRDFPQGMQKGGKLKKSEENIVPLGKEEAVRQSRYPEGDKVEKKQSAIEREDWPAPPYAAAAYPEKLREREYPLGKVRIGFYSKDDQSDSSPTSPVKALTDTEEEQENIDPRLKRNIMEISKLNKSGVGKLLLRDFEKKAVEEPLIDVVSASRTPSAAREPPYKTRYESHIFASPSRDLAYRPRTYSMDDLLLDKKYRTSGVPVANYPVARPGYSRGRMTKSAGEAGRPTDGYMSEPAYVYETKRQPLVYTRKEIEDNLKGKYDAYESADEVDPETGLRRSRYRFSGAKGTFQMPTYMAYNLSSAPSRFKAEEQPQIYTYEQLKISNPSLPADVERNSTERHLSKEEFESIFHMRREDFYRLAEWKRNDLKRRMDLY